MLFLQHFFPLACFEITELGSLPLALQPTHQHSWMWQQIPASFWLQFFFQVQSAAECWQWTRAQYEGTTKKKKWPLKLVCLGQRGPKLPLKVVCQLLFFSAGLVGAVIFLFLELWRFWSEYQSLPRLVTSKAAIIESNSTHSAAVRDDN